MKGRSLAIGSTLAAFLAWLCCLGPLLLGRAGLGAALVAMFAPLRPYFLAVSAILLAGGFYFVYRKPKASVRRRDVRTEKRDSPHGEAFALTGDACGCCAGFFSILRRQVGRQIGCGSANLFGNSPKSGVGDGGCEGRSAVPGWLGNSAIQPVANRYQQTDRSSEGYGVQGSRFQSCARIRCLA